MSYGYKMDHEHDDDKDPPGWLMGLGLLLVVFALVVYPVVLGTRGGPNLHGMKWPAETWEQYRVDNNCKLKHPQPERNGWECDGGMTVWRPTR